MFEVTDETDSREQFLRHEHDGRALVRIGDVTIGGAEDDEFGDEPAEAAEPQSAVPAGAGAVATSGEVDTAPDEPADDEEPTSVPAGTPTDPTPDGSEPPAAAPPLQPPPIGPPTDFAEGPADDGDGDNEPGQEPTDAAPPATDASVLATPPAASETVITDPELAELLTKGAEALGDEALNKVLEAAHRFDPAPVNMRHADGSTTTIEHYRARGVLAELPAFAEAAAAAQVDVETATDLLTHALDTYRFDHLGPENEAMLMRRQRPGVDTALLTKAFQASAETGTPLTPSDIEAVKGLITQAGEDGFVKGALNAFALCRQIGLSVEDSIAVPADYMNSHNGRQIGQTGAALPKALEALTEAQVPPELVKATFDKFLTVHPEATASAYQDFRGMLAFESQAMGMTPTEFVQAINNHIDVGGMDMFQAMERTLEGYQLASSSDEPVVLSPGEAVERRFLDKPGPLVQAVTSYRTQRSLNDGARDLEQLTDTVAQNWERVGEGNWTYDPASQTWYSMGGDTTYRGGGGGTHRSAYFDQSALSETPVSVHIHPADYAFNEADQVANVFPSNADFGAVAMMIEKATGPIQPSSIISHASGFTRIEYPPDSALIREVSEHVEALWHRVLGEGVGNEATIVETARQVGVQPIAEWAVNEFNRLLPEGFLLPARHRPRRSTRS